MYYFSLVNKELAGGPDEKLHLQMASKHLAPTSIRESFLKKGSKHTKMEPNAAS